MRMRLRLIVAFAVVVLVAIASVLVIARQTTAAQVRSFVSRGGMMGVDTLADDLEEYYARFGSWQGAEAVLDSYRFGRGHGMMGPGMMGGAASIRLRLAGPDGSVLADNMQAPRGSLSREEMAAAVALRGQRGQTLGYLLAEGGSSPAAEARLLAGLARAGWIAAAVSGALALLLALAISYRLLKPVDDLTQAAAQLAAGDLSRRVPVEGGAGDELATLGRSFNQMAASLQRAEQNRRAMTADIAHELRTPISIQRAHLEALQDGVYPLTVENLNPVLEQTGLLARLVDDLRTLALADAGELTLEPAPVDLSALVQRVVDRFQPQAARKQIRLALDRTAWADPAVVTLDPGRVEQILNNLIGNALRYTPEGGTVTVRLMRAAGWAELRVSDSGPGIDPQDLPRVFERFYRADKSRSREAGGSGLGLSIARQLALAHGGDVSAANRPEGGAEFTLRLPLETVTTGTTSA